MIKLIKKCFKFENMTTYSKYIFVNQNSKIILNKLQFIDLEINTIKIYSKFLIGAIVENRKVNEIKYLEIYPMLSEVFGKKYNFAAIKIEVNDEIDSNSFNESTYFKFKNMLLMGNKDLAVEIVLLSICVLSSQSKINMKQRKYLLNILNNNR